MGQEGPFAPGDANKRVPWWDLRPQARAGTKIEGAGDVVEIAAAAVGAKKCGSCERRRKALNRVFGRRRGR